MREGKNIRKRNECSKEVAELQDNIIQYIYIKGKLIIQKKNFFKNVLNA